MAKKSITLEDGYLLSMASNSSFIKEFPVLATITSSQPATRRCGCTGDAKQATVLSRVKQSLASMDAGKKKKLKELLHADEVRIVFRDGRGKKQRLTF